MQTNKILKLLFFKPRAVLVRNSGVVSCSKPYTNNSDDRKEQKYKGYHWRSVGLGFGIGVVCYNIITERRNPLYNTGSPKFSFLPRVCSLGIGAENAQSQEKSSPRVVFNFLADVAEKTAPSVVYIEINARHPVTGKSIPISNGSGFVVKSDGLILTNAHVVSRYGHVLVKLYDGREFKGLVEDLDTESDLATVRINVKNLPELPLGQSSNLRPGEFVIAMGNPLTLSHTITAGVVSSPNRQGKELGLHKKSDYIQTDAAINVGNSGGPLVNLDGEAIGINTMKVTEGISFAIPSDRAVDFLNRAEAKRQGNISSGSWNPFSKSLPAEKRQKYLGITMLTLTPALIQELKEHNPQFPDIDHGVMVWRVMFGSPSYECGIKPGDVITSINGKKVCSASDIYKFLGSEDVLNIHIVRKKKEFDVVVELFDPVLP